MPEKKVCVSGYVWWNSTS